MSKAYDDSVVVDEATALADSCQVPHLIVFDDAERPPELVIGTLRARYRFEQVSMSWNAHLFVKVTSNSADEPSPGLIDLLEETVALRAHVRELEAKLAAAAQQAT